ncbi:HEAT repeat domain-containing protein [Synechococcus sp. CBW1006]|uniref:HEAT repeat domain-containing protein n=1 Tax=Synechococcus sp. CBW1006 TaxID=1353138 RepID=UPI0018CD81E3|nr:HEAT repeat domain-containing protein [Synechococcus sp. CBW1006]QPN66438.1 HEAT repeat domain-containing protein [Synechococcus sp. CBW1006]
MNEPVSSTRFNNIHPGLTQEEALRILALPVDQLEASSDRYMAAAQLLNFPGRQSEFALLQLLADSDDTQATLLAKRKAVEVLARLGCRDAIKSIGTCLVSDDHYLVENAAWALHQLDCQDHYIIKQMMALLADQRQNRRVLIQSLAGLGLVQAVPEIRSLQDDDAPGVRGAAIAALATLDGSRDRILSLGELLFLPNQMDRQSAIQDVIDAGATELLAEVLRAPVSPVFRMRAVRLLWPQSQPLSNGLSLLETLDSLLLDSPASLQLVHRYAEQQESLFLINELFGTDFSRCYLALQALADEQGDRLWPLLEQRWLEEAHNDYGAHYFFLRLFSMIDSWGDEKGKVEMLCEDAIFNRRPQFAKSRPAAILALLDLQPVRLRSHFAQLLDPEAESNWECRYATWMAVEQMVSTGMSVGTQVLPQFNNFTDPCAFVESKKQSVARLFADF